MTENIFYLFFLVIGFYYLEPATWRLSNLLMYETGPFNIFSKIRDLLGVRETWDDGEEDLGFFHDLLTCINCTSIWVATFLALLVLTGYGAIAVSILGASGGAIKYSDQ